MDPTLFSIKLHCSGPLNHPGSLLARIHSDIYSRYFKSYYKRGYVFIIMSTEEPKLDLVSKPKRTKSYKQMMREIMKPKQEKTKKVTGIGGGNFEKVVQI